VVCQNPLVATERRRKREDLLRATEADLGHIRQRVAKGRTLPAHASLGNRENQAFLRASLAHLVAGHDERQVIDIDTSRKCKWSV